MTKRIFVFNGARGIKALKTTAVGMPQEAQRSETMMLRKKCLNIITSNGTVLLCLGHA